MVKRSESQIQTDIDARQLIGFAVAMWIGLILGVLILL